MSFIKPDLQFTVVDALRPGHEMWYYPGETNFRSADVIVINKVGENPTDVKRIEKNIEKANPDAEVIYAYLELIPVESNPRDKQEGALTVEFISQIITLFAFELLLLGPFLDMINSRQTDNICQKAHIAS